MSNPTDDTQTLGTNPYTVASSPSSKQDKSNPNQLPSGQTPANGMLGVNPYTISTSSTPAQASQQKQQQAKDANQIAIDNAPMDVGASNVMRGLIPFGLSDRLGVAPLAIKAAMLGQGSFSDNYDKLLKAQFDARDAYRNQHPAADLGQEALGTLISLPVTGLGGLIGKGLPSLALTPDAVKGGLTVAGAAINGGMTNVAQSRPEDATLPAFANGAITGGALAGTLGALGAAGRGIYNSNVGNTLFKSAQRNADDIIRQGIALQGKTLGQYAQEMLQAVNAKAFNPITEQELGNGALTGGDYIANNGTILADAVRKALSKPVPQREQLDQRFQGLVNSSNDNLKNLIASTITDTTDPGGMGSMLVKNAYNRANNLYGVARDLPPVDSPELANFFNKSDFNRSLLDTLAGGKQSLNLRTPQLAEDMPAPVSSILGPNGSPITLPAPPKPASGWAVPPTVGDLIQLDKNFKGIARRVMDNQPNRTYDPMDLNNVAGEFRSLINNSTNDATKEAIGAHALAASMDEARQAGQKFTSATPQSVREMVEQYADNPAVRNVYNMGAAESLQNRVGNSVPSLNWQQKLADIPNLNEKLNAISPNPEVTSYLNAALNQQKMLANSYDKFNPQKIALNDTNKLGDILRSIAGFGWGHPFIGTANAAHALADKNMSPKTVAALLDTVFSKNPDEFAEYLTKLSQPGLITGPLSAIGRGLPQAIENTGSMHSPEYFRQQR